MLAVFSSKEGGVVRAGRAGCANALTLPKATAHATTMRPSRLRIGFMNPPFCERAEV
jgi:hypothetical protein